MRYIYGLIGSWRNTSQRNVSNTVEGGALGADLRGYCERLLGIRQALACLLWCCSYAVHSVYGDDGLLKLGILLGTDAGRRHAG
jgi:hypothetical protein